MNMFLLVNYCKSHAQFYNLNGEKETEIKRNFMDMLTVSITTKEYTDWINNEAYD